MSASGSVSDSASHDTHTELTEYQKELQKKLLTVVKELIEMDVPLPPDLKLYYTVMEHSDRRGTAIKMSPHLTKRAARKHCGKPQEWDGKYGSTITYSVIRPCAYVSTENYYSVCNRNCDAEYKILKD